MSSSMLPTSWWSGPTLKWEKLAWFLWSRGSPMLLTWLLAHCLPSTTKWKLLSCLKISRMIFCTQWIACQCPQRATCNWKPKLPLCTACLLTSPLLTGRLCLNVTFWMPWESFLKEWRNWASSPWRKRQRRLQWPHFCTCMWLCTRTHCLVLGPSMEWLWTWLRFSTILRLVSQFLGWKCTLAAQANWQRIGWRRPMEMKSLQCLTFLWPPSTQRFHWGPLRACFGLKHQLTASTFRRGMPRRSMQILWWASSMTSWRNGTPSRTKKSCRTCNTAEWTHCLCRILVSRPCQVCLDGLCSPVLGPDLTMLDLCHCKMAHLLLRLWRPRPMTNLHWRRLRPKLGKLCKRKGAMPRLSHSLQARMETKRKCWNAQQLPQVLFWHEPVSRESTKSMGAQDAVEMWKDVLSAGMTLSLGRDSPPEKNGRNGPSKTTRSEMAVARFECGVPKAHFSAFAFWVPAAATSANHWRWAVSKQ